MRKLKAGWAGCSVLIAFLSAASAAAAKEQAVEYVIRDGLEIIGAEERPRVMFLIPEVKVLGKDFKIDMNYILKKNIMKKDIDRLIKEDK